ncbi:MAG TPA: YciI family protein [Methylomirabilota bacterium]|nr:YciI family protein [Methylomirabilota bacterium]
MTVVHVLISCAEDYVVRRAPVRQAHIERLLRLRAAGALVAGGPAPDGRSAELFYRVPDQGALRAIVEEDPYVRAGAWTGFVPQEFETVVDPWEAEPPVVLDGSRPALVVEGATGDRDMAQLALVELRGAGRVVFGGFLANGGTLAVLRTTDPGEATGWLSETGSWKPGDLVTRPWLHVI